MPDDVPSIPPSRQPSRRPSGRGHLKVGAAVLAAFVAGSAFGGTVPHGAAEPTDDGAGGRRALAVGGGALPPTDSGAVRAAASCDALLAKYVERGQELVGPWGWDGGGGVVYLDGVLSDVGSSEVAPPGAQSRMRAATSSATGTNVQESGVDEPDVVKTDGALLVRLDDDELSAWDVTGRDPVRLGTVGLPDIEQGQMLLVGDRAVVIGRGGDTRRPETEVVVVDLADPADPTVLARSSLDARLVEARQHGGTVRLVTASGLPDLDFVEPGDRRSSTSALRENRELLEGTDLDDWLPHGPDGGLLLPCDAVGVPEADGGLGTLAISTLLPAGERPEEPVAATGLLSASDTAYVSQTRIYVATAPATASCCWPVGPVADSGRPWHGPGHARDDGATALHAFALDGDRTTYVASGEVDGLVRERWWMDERGGVLRVAVAPTRATGNFNSVVTLTEDGDRLVEIGRLDKIGVNEDIQSVRWFDRMAVVVTFRRIDPLHVIDLTDDTRPTLRGELKVPGFSAYLHPLGTQRLLGIGEGPTEPGAGRRGGWGAQAALFDLADLENPRAISELHWAPRSVAGATRDPRQFTWLPRERVALTVVWRRSARLGRTGRVSVLDMGGGTLARRSVEVEYGDDVEDVRLVPLPAEPDDQRADGPTRVVLVTGDGVQRFDLRG